MTGVPFFLAARAAVSNASQRPALEMSSRASFGVSAEAKDRAFSGTGLIVQRLPRLLSLSEASMATGRLLLLASISMISAARRMESTFLSWTRFKA